MLTGITSTKNTTSRRNSITPAKKENEAKDGGKETEPHQSDKKAPELVEGEPIQQQNQTKGRGKSAGNKKITDYFRPVPKSERVEGENDSNNGNSFVKQLQNSLKLTPTKKPQHHSFASSSPNPAGSLTPSSLLSKRLANSLRLSSNTSSKKPQGKQLTIDEILEKCAQKSMEIDDSLVTQVTPETAFLSPSNIDKTIIVIDSSQDVLFNADVDENPFALTSCSTKITTTHHENDSQDALIFTCPTVENDQLENPFDELPRLTEAENVTKTFKKKVRYSVDKSINACMKLLIEKLPNYSPLVVPTGSPDLEVSSGLQEFNQFLLPPSCQSPKIEGEFGIESRKRKTLVLDLDETLIHCVSGGKPEVYDFEFNVKFKGEVLKFYCKLRPFLFHFLEHAKSKFEIVIFTASQQPYADTLLDILDPKGEFFHHRLFRTACTFSNGFYVKNLSRLGRPIEHTVIIDNSPQAFLYHVENGIPIMSWFGDLEDRELLRLVGFLEELRAHDGDSREFLRQHFEWLK